MDIDDFYWFWLCNIPGIGNRKIRSLLAVFADAAAVYRATVPQLRAVKGLTEQNVRELLKSRKTITYESACALLREKNVRFTYRRHQSYPARLKTIEDSPEGLYYRGRLPEENRLTVAIVGARSCTAYGRNVAFRFAQEFAGMGIQVISGMAAGIDTAGHEGCLSHQGYTCAVLGCGVDVCYPRSNISLYTQIGQEGGILSEYPVGMPAAAALFPPRNRIISGLSDIVIVVEARRRSGSLITVDQALEQNREVMVVPGRIDDPFSAGCNTLIKMGAQMITSPLEVLNSAAAHRLKTADPMAKNRPDDGRNRGSLPPETKNCSAIMLAREKDIVYSCLDYSNPKSLNNIIEETGQDLPTVSERLLNLQLEGCIREVSKNCYIRIYI